MPTLFDKYTQLENFGHSLQAGSYLLQPESTEELKTAFKLARQAGLTITLRGGGKSYNDAALNGGGIVMDFRRMARILEWDPTSGIITVEPGVTLQQVWQTVLPDGWWLPVVSGTMFTTLGGCLGMDIHGKNDFRLGPIGEHVIRFTALLPTGAQVTCSPQKNGDLFHALIGGLGVLGVFTSITLKMKRVHSGFLKVHAWNVPDLKTHLEAIEEAAPIHDYTVGWLDCTARGRHLGRGQLHTADYLAEGEDPDPSRSLRVDFQTLPDKFFGLVPKSVLHRFMAPFMFNLGVRCVNAAKYLVGREKSYRQTHAAFHFLLDYVPQWELAYGHLIQHQSFLPKDNALDAWKEMLALSIRRSLPAYLGVSKRHRPDDFLLTHALDGYSLAMDFKITRANFRSLAGMLADFDRIVLDAGGRFYFAKNSETSPETARRFLGKAVIARFKALKDRCDPDHLLESDLYRRVFESGR